MANIRKQFNFRNGVQVDNDNLIVSASGLVGIGTSIPTESLDVRGNLKVVGLATCNSIYTPSLTAETANITSIQLDSSSASIVGGGVSISSGIVTASGSGIVTYYGDGVNLRNIPTSQWRDVDVGLGFTSIYAAGFVGVGTVDPRFVFQVSGNNDSSLAGFSGGVGISSGGNVLATGIVTASSFVGVGSDITGLTGSNIAYGTIGVDRLPTIPDTKLNPNLNLGIVTVTTLYSSGIVSATSLSLDAGASIGSSVSIGGSLSVASYVEVTDDITIGYGLTISRIGAAATISSHLHVGAGATINGNLVVTDTITANESLIIGNNVDIAGITTIGGTLEVTGDITGTASTARGLTGSPDIVVNQITANAVSASSFVGGLVGDLTGTATTAINLTPTSVIDIESATAGIGSFATLETTKVGIGTSVPTTDIQIYSNNTITIQGISTSSEVRVALGRSTTVDEWNGVVRYGNINSAYSYSNEYSLDFINYGDGSINSYLQSGAVGVNTGNFNWFKGQTEYLMTLTYDGKLGIGNTEPEHPLDVVGTSTHTGSAYFGDTLDVIGKLFAHGNATIDGDLTVNGTISLPGEITANLNGNVNIDSGISTFNSVTSSFIGIGTDSSFPQAVVPEVFSLNSPGSARVFIDQAGNIGIKTTIINNQGLTAPQLDCLISGVGIGTTRPRCAIDFSFAFNNDILGADRDTVAYVLFPRLTTTQRNNLTNVNNAGVEDGAVIYNSDNKRLEFKHPDGWCGIATTRI